MIMRDRAEVQNEGSEAKGQGWTDGLARAIQPQGHEDDADEEKNDCRPVGHNLIAVALTLPRV